MATLRSSDSSSHFHLQTEDRLEKAQQSPLISPAVDMPTPGAKSIGPPRTP